MDELKEMMVAYAADAVDLGSKLNKPLDYSEESIKQVEGICSLLYNDIPKSFFTKLLKKSPSEEKFVQMSKVLGAYIGEVMIKHFGGSWSIEDFMNEGNTLILTIGELKTFPVNKVYKRLKSGPADDVSYYYFVMTKELPRKSNL